MVNTWAVTRSTYLKGMVACGLVYALVCGLLYSVPGNDRAFVVESSPVDLNLEVPEFAGSEMFMMGPPGAYGLLPETQVSLSLASGSIPVPWNPNSYRDEPVQPPLT